MKTPSLIPPPKDQPAQSSVRRCCKMCGYLRSVDALDNRGYCNTCKEDTNPELKEMVVKMPSLYPNPKF